MKIRSGFVSNSSSSSFIVHGVKIKIEEFENLKNKDLVRGLGLVIQEDKNYFSDSMSENYIVGKCGGWLEDGEVKKLQWLTENEKTELIEKFDKIGIVINSNQIETYIQYVSNDNY